jgi:hypothetical protein
MSRTKSREVRLKVLSLPGRIKTIRPVFGNYVTRNSGFVEYLNAVKTQIETYTNKSGRVCRPLNIFIAAPPGSGKSFLIKEIISGIEDHTFEEIYIASLDHPNELHGVFHRVQSANIQRKIPVVFFDEIDAVVAGGHVYARLLAPMWDGTFYIGKEKFYLGRCIFFFAGSSLSLESESANIVAEHTNKTTLCYDDYFEKWANKFVEFYKKQPDKLSDFMDRVDAIIRIPPICKQLLGDQLEQEYEDLAVMLIKKSFPDVSKIHPAALSVICHALTSESSMRKAEKLVFSSSLALSDTFSLDSLPPRSRAIATESDLAKRVWEVEVSRSQKKRTYEIE